MSDPLPALLSRRRPGHSLEAPFYTSDEIFRADLDRIFARHWIFVGQEPDVPNAGDIRALHIGEAPILLVRGEDGGIRAFHNVCRHRGAQLVADGSGQAARLVCRYHAWTYGLDGSLLFANHMGEDFDAACRGLHPVALRSIAGLLFVCLAADPPDDIDEMAAAMEPYLLPHRIAETRIARQIDIVENGNWKLTLENNRECYHCAANHPELTVPLFSYGFGFSPASLDAQEQAEAARYETMVGELHGRWEAAGLPSRRIERLTGRATGFRTERLPLDRAGESHTADTRVACRVLLGGMTDKRSGGLSFWTQPNSWHHFMSDHAVTFCALPLAADRTLVRTTWLVHKDAVEGVDYDPANLTAVWEATNRQDAALVEITQAGVRSPAYAPGPYSPHTEGLVEDFCTWYIERMQAADGRRHGSRRQAERAARAEPPPTPVSPPPAEAMPAGGVAGAVPEAATEFYTIEFATSNRSIVCPANRTVLEAAREAGIVLPFSCGKGLCGTCKSRIISGTLAMNHRGGIRQRDIDDGLALLCCSRPTSDLVIER